MRGSYKRASMWCQECEKQVGAEKNAMACGCGDFILLLPTIGIWVPVRFVIDAMTNPYRCPDCGSTTGGRQPATRPVKRQEAPELARPPREPIRRLEALPRFKPRFPLALPETWMQRAVLVATILLAEGIAFVILGAVLGRILGRHSDIIELGIISTAIGAVMWALALVARVK